jgi:hypothetical protein
VEGAASFSEPPRIEDSTLQDTIQSMDTALDLLEIFFTKSHAELLWLGWP